MIVERARKIKLLMLDVDGVLTDGKIYYSRDGNELQSFHVQDGMGMGLWHQAGLESVILSGRRTKMVNRRAREMHVSKVLQAIEEKEEVFLKILREMEKEEEEVCFIGDDLLDIPLLRRVGLGVAVSNAVPEVQQVAHYVTQRSGGHGAVREVIDLILKANGKLEEVTQSFLRSQSCKRLNLKNSLSS